MKMPVLTLITCILVPACAWAQKPSLSAGTIVTWTAGDRDSLSAARSALAGLASTAPNSVRADSVANGLISFLRSPNDDTVARIRMLSSLTMLASVGNATAIDGLFWAAETLGPSDRRNAIQLLNKVPDTRRVRAHWQSAAADSSAGVAAMAVEMLAHSGPEGLAALKGLVERGAVRNPVALSRAIGLLDVMSRHPR